MRNYEIMFEQVERVIHKYNQKENVKHNYGGDVFLTQTEIHLIRSIGTEPGIGVKRLAQNHGVTDGAISQMVRKLVGKGLVTKKISQISEAKIELTLTDNGQTCFEEHHRYHVEKNQKWYDILNRLDDSSYKDLVRLVEQIEEQLAP